MTDSPDNNLEKQLRSYAKNRRDAAGTPKLHPATRQLLQAEVRQKLGNAAAQAPAPSSGWFKFLPRFGLALGLFLLLGIGAVLLVSTDGKSKQKFSLAQQDKLVVASPAANGAVASPAVATADAPVGGAWTNSLSAASAFSGNNRRADPMTGQNDANLTLAKPISRDTSKETAPVAAVAMAAVARPQKMSAAPERSLPYSSPKPTPKTDVAATTKTIASVQNFENASSVELKTKVADAKHEIAGSFSDGYMAKKTDATIGELTAAKNKDSNINNFAGNSLRYRNVAVSDAQPKKGLPVLSEFTVSQTGDAVTIVDHDGSIYNGFARLVSVEQLSSRYAENGAAAASGAMQLVPNSNMGGRGRAVFNQTAQNRAGDSSAIQSHAENGLVAASQAGNSQGNLEPLNYSFQVEGTNRSLNQRVVLTGNIYQNNGNQFFNNAANSQFYRQQNTPTGAANQVNFNRSQQVPVQNNFINGRVQLGDKHIDEFNALSIDP